jgi:hypothetical protein
MFTIFRIVVAIHVQELEAIHQRGIFLLCGEVLLAGQHGPVQGSRTLIVVPLDLGAFVGTTKS